MSEKPMPVKLEDGHLYTLERVRGFDALCPKTVGKEARIRLLLNAATKLDIPLSRESLIALADELRKYLSKVEEFPNR